MNRRDLLLTKEINDCSTLNTSARISPRHWSASSQKNSWASSEQRSNQRGEIGSSVFGRNWILWLKKKKTKRIDWFLIHLMQRIKLCSGSVLMDSHMLEAREDVSKEGDAWDRGRWWKRDWGNSSGSGKRRRVGREYEISQEERTILSSVTVMSLT